MFGEQIRFKQTTQSPIKTKYFEAIKLLGLLMSSNLFENELLKVSTQIKQKKPSRQERKLQQAIRLINKMEGNVQKPQNKKRNYSNSLMPISQPKKKVKMEIQSSDAQSSSLNNNQNQLSSSSSSCQQPKQPKKVKNIINHDYLSDQNQDLYSHLLQYELNEKEKFMEIVNGEQLELNKLPQTQAKIKIFSLDVKEKTENAFKKIRDRFEQSRMKLMKTTSRQHKEFNSQFMSLSYLLD